MEPHVEQELLAWRAFWQRTLGHLKDINRTAPEKLHEIFYDASDMAFTHEGGLADQLFKEYQQLKQGHSLLIQQGKAPEGAAVVTLAAGDNGWELASNMIQNGEWLIPGRWSHWFFLLTVPSHGPDGRRLNPERIDRALQGFEIRVRD